MPKNEKNEKRKRAGNPSAMTSRDNPGGLCSPRGILIKGIIPSWDLISHYVDLERPVNPFHYLD